MFPLSTLEKRLGGEVIGAYRHGLYTSKHTKTHRLLPSLHIPILGDHEIEKYHKIGIVSK